MRVRQRAAIVGGAVAAHVDAVCGACLEFHRVPVLVAVGIDRAGDRCAHRHPARGVGVGGGVAVGGLSDGDVRGDVGHRQRPGPCRGDSISSGDLGVYQHCVQCLHVDACGGARRRGALTGEPLGWVDCGKLAVVGAARGIVEGQARVRQGAAAEVGLLRACAPRFEAVHPPGHQPHPHSVRVADMGEVAGGCVADEQVRPCARATVHVAAMVLRDCRGGLAADYEHAEIARNSAVAAHRHIERVRGIGCEHHKAVLPGT